MAPSQRRTRAALAAGWLGLVVLHLVLSAPLTGPSVVFDEAGYLGNARWLAGSAGGATWAMPTSPSYASGYSLVLAPVVALVHGPDLQWRAVLVVNALLLATVLPLLFEVLTRVVGVARRPALAGALVGAVAPAVLAAGVSAIAEDLVLPLVLLLVLAAHALVEPPTGRGAWIRYGLGPVTATLVTTHPRFTLAVPVVLAALAVAGWRRLAPRLVVATNVSLLVVLGAAGW
ncbi:MAG: hypothetical protein KF703_18850, partial [Actinobacteria bacterium]|nr:hypothetical protein [Actinomycetota bacterium]